MGVKDLLKGGFAVGQEEVDALATKPGGTERSGEPHGDGEHLSPSGLIEIGQVRSVPLGDHQQMTGCDRPDIHEGKQIRIVIDDARRGPAGHDRAEDAVSRG